MQRLNKYTSQKISKWPINVWKDVQDNYSPEGCKLKPVVTNIHPPEELKLIGLTWLY